MDALLDLNLIIIYLNQIPECENVLESFSLEMLALVFESTELYTKNLNLCLCLWPLFVAFSHSSIVCRCLIVIDYRLVI